MCFQDVRIWTSNKRCRNAIEFPQKSTVENERAGVAEDELNLALLVGAHKVSDDAGGALLRVEAERRHLARRRDGERHLPYSILVRNRSDHTFL